MAIPLEEIQKDIQAMGYITATPRKTPMPSLYKLNDGTILSITTHINHFIQDPLNPNNASVNMTPPQLLVFVPPDKRNLHGKQGGPNVSVTITDEDVEYDTLKEDFNVYDLSNGAVFSIKTVLGQVQKTDLHTPIGEPVYNINSQPIIRIKTNNKRPR